MKKTLYSILFLFFGHLVSYSQTGEIQGKVIDDKGQPVMAAAVQIITDKEGLKPTSKGAKTDANGFYTIKGLSSSKFNVMARFTGKGKDFEYDVEVYPGRPTTVNFQLGAKSNTISGITVTTSRPKNTTKIDVFKPVSSTVSAEQIKDNSVRDVNSLVAASAGVVQADRGQDINVAGDRSGGNVYFVDGVKMSGGTPNIPPSAIQNVEVMVTGVPAKYGDVTGGVVSITTKGPSNEFRGNIEGLTSQMLDPFGYNVISGSIGGPILRKRGDTIGGKPTKGEAILGYYLNAQYESNADGSPRINGNYKIKDDVFKDLIARPYRLDQTGTRIVKSQEFIRGSDIVETSNSQNTSNSNIALVGKIDWKLNDNGTNLTFQGRYGTSTSNDLVARYQLVNSENNPVEKNNNYSGFVRLYQPLFKQNSDKQANSMIRNANFTIQADYEKTQQT
ncbi:MAG: carboxypeptidase regulatory-like domain-containing protein, partial [Chitinophagales bacterium]